MIFIMAGQRSVYEDEVAASVPTVDINMRATVSVQPAEAAAARPSGVVLEMNSEVSQWTAAEYKNMFLDCPDVRRFEAVFSDCRNAMMYDQRGVRQDTDIGGRNRH